MRFSELLAERLRPRDRRPIPDWAHDHVRLFPPLTKTGPFDASGSRHFIPVFDALQDERVREVNILKPVRGGGTLMADVWLPWTISNDAGPFMFLLQTDAIAGEHAEAIVTPMLNACDEVARLFPQDRHKKRDQEILFSNGFPFYISGPSLANLQTKGIRYLVEDECWCWERGRMAEAEGRVGDYVKAQNSKVVRISQGGPRDFVTLDDCEWHRAWNRGERNEWEVECCHCQKFFEPVFSGQREDGSFWGITWDHHKLTNGDWDLGKCIPSVRFECPHCLKPILDGAKTKTEWNRTGRYKTVGEPNIKRRGFHWESVVDYPWEELVELWLDACNAERRGSIKPKLQFYQKRRAMFRDEESLLRGSLHLKRTTYEINSAWPEEKARFMTVDRQEEGLYWWSVRAWSMEKSRRLGFGKAYGVGELEKLREQFKVEPQCLLIDSAFQPKGDGGVYAACVRYGWVAVRGATEWAFVHRLKKGRFVQRSYSERTWGDPSAGTALEGRRFAPLIRFSKNQFNDTVQRLIDTGAWEEPATGDEEIEREYAAQMSSRVKRTEYNVKTNEAKAYWREGKNDHARDLANMQALGAVLRDLLPDPVAERETKTEETK